MSLSQVNKTQQAPLQSFLDSNDILNHTLSFLEEESSLQSVCKAFNRRCSEALIIKLNKIQDILIKAGFLENEKRIAFETKLPAINNVTKELGRGLAEIAKRIHPKMIKEIRIIANRKRESLLQPADFAGTILDFLKDKNLPYAENLGVECMLQLAQQRIGIGWEYPSTAGDSISNYPNIVLNLLCEYLIAKKKPLLALYITEKMVVSGSDDELTQQSNYCHIALSLIENGQCKLAIGLLRKVKNLVENLREIIRSGKMNSFKKGMQAQALYMACRLLVEKGFIREALENYQKSVNTNFPENTVGFVDALIKKGAGNDSIFTLLRSCEDEENREHLIGAAVKCLLKLKKFDQLVALLEDQEFTATKFEKPPFFEQSYIWHHLMGYLKVGSDTTGVKYSYPEREDEDFFLKNLNGQELIDFLSKFKNLELKKYLFMRTKSELWRLGRNQEAKDFENLLNGLDKKDKIQGTKEVSSEKQIQTKQQIKDPAPSQTKERSVQVPQAATTLKKPTQPISQPKIPAIQSPTSIDKKEPKSSCLYGKDFVAAFWKQSLAFRIFSFLTFGLLPLITFLIGGLCRRQEATVC